MKPLDHSQIEGLLFFEDPVTHNVIGAAKAAPLDLSGHFVAFGPRITVDPLLKNLFLAAPTLYQTLSQQYQAIQGLIEIAEGLPQTPELDKLQRSFVEMQNGMLMAQLVAQKGIEEVANSLDKPPK